MKSLALFLALPLVTLSGELVVSPEGLSPQQALLKIRAAKAAGDTSAWTVRVKEGVYPLAETLVFTPADSGTPKAPVTWRGEGEKSVIAGGAPLTGWRDDGHGVWSAPVPVGKDGKSVYFEQLWVNGRRADRARIPNRCPGALTNEYLRIKAPRQVETGKLRFAESIGLADTSQAALIARTPADELPWAQMCVVHKWSFARRVLAGFDAVSNRIETCGSQKWGGWVNWSERETIVWFENVRAGFDAPGEWFYDVKAGRILYRPLPGETLATLQAIPPSAKLSQLVAFRGDPDKGAYVHDIRFEKLAFAFSDGVGEGSPANGPTQAYQHQAASGYDGAVTAMGAHRLSWDDCRFGHTGNYGLRFNDGCVSNTVKNCTLEDLGCGGVWMGAAKSYWAKGEKAGRFRFKKLHPRSTAYNRIENCTIRNGGLFNPEGTGVAYTHVSDSKVLHCDIYDFFYTGVSVGWTWGFQGSVAQRNEIAFNRIYDLGKGIMSDMGGVYTLGLSYDTQVHDNVIHDVWSYSYGGWALYCDEGSEDITMERNLCWNTTDGGFHQHYGAGCFIRNNIFAWNRTLGAVRMQRPWVQEVRCTLNFANNIVLVKEGPLVGRGVRNVGGLWAANLWWDASGKTPEFDGLKGWEAWVKTGKECGGVYADPRFVDAERFDFRLKPDSPAFALGFKAWDHSQAGVKK